MSVVGKKIIVSDDDDDDDDDDEADGPLKIPADLSIMDYLSTLPNLGESFRTKFLSKVGIEAKKKEIARFLGEKEVKGMTHLEIKQKFNQLDNWKFSQIAFPSSAPPRFVVEAQKAKDKEKRELEKERRKKGEGEEEEEEEEKEEKKKKKKKRRAEEEEVKKKEETEEKKKKKKKIEEADKENQGVRSNRKCAVATKRKMKLDAEEKSEVKIVSDIRQALKGLSDFEASSSDDEWTEKGPKGRKKAKGKKKRKNDKTKKKKKTIIFRHDPSHNPFIPAAADGESDVEEDQLLIPCTWCPEQHKFGICPKRPDKLPNYVPSKNVDDESLSELSRAEASLPENLSIKESRIAGADMGVWYKFARNIDKTPLPRGTIFGPYEGRLLSSEEEADRSGTAWEVRLSNGKSVFIDGDDDDEANWLKYVNCSRTAKEQNLYAFEFRGAIYYLVIREVLPHTEFLVYYGDAYANTLGIYDEPSPDKSDQSYCDKCHAYFSDESSLAKHLSLGHEKVWPCELCQIPVFTNSKESLARHVRRKHASPRRDYAKERHAFVCPTCGKAFTRAGRLSAHMTIHTGICPKPFKCDQCGKQYKRRKDLGRHRREVHEKRIGNLKCDICGKRFFKQSDLTKHLRVHTGEKPFECPVCKVTFRQTSGLRSHQRKCTVHSDEKTFECDICGSRFRSSPQLTGHLRRHTGEKLLKCDICGKGFVCPAKLTRHLPVHTGEKPFKCSVCDAAFNHKHNCQKHERRCVLKAN